MTMVLVPFDSVKACPACGCDTKGFSVEYSTSIQIPAGDGRFVDASTIGDPPRPHLEKHCPHCRFGWLEEISA